MATPPMSEVIQHLRRMVLGDGAGLTDGQLLEEFVRGRQEAALAALVRRHGPMVWGVCRRVLFNYHDAEDAFQSTFLVLVRKAASISAPELVGNWLHGVAYQTALKARARAARRAGRERQVDDLPHSVVTGQELRLDLKRLLDQELNRLPEMYRILLVLCDLEGKTRRETARQLAIPEGTVAGRLVRARAMLAKRLAGKGLAGSVGMLSPCLLPDTAFGGAPGALMFSTIRAASLMAAGNTVNGAVTLDVVHLTERMVNAMFIAKFKSMTTAMMVVVVVAALAAGALHRALATDQAVQDPRRPLPPPVAAVNAQTPMAPKGDPPNLVGVYSLYSSTNTDASIAATMEIPAQLGGQFLIGDKTQGWEGRGVIEGKKGYYDWVFTDGKSGRTTFTVDADGNLQGQVRGSGIDWDYVAKRQIDDLASRLLGIHDVASVIKHIRFHLDFSSPLTESLLKVVALREKYTVLHKNDDSVTIVNKEGTPTIAVECLFNRTNSKYYIGSIVVAKDGDKLTYPSLLAVPEAYRAPVGEAVEALSQLRQVPTIRKDRGRLIWMYGDGSAGSPSLSVEAMVNADGQIYLGAVVVNDGTRGETFQNALAVPEAIRPAVQIAVDELQKASGLLKLKKN
jgi:RNA polymerase sigma factor (sigma-70 family)